MKESSASRLSIAKRATALAAREGRKFLMRNLRTAKDTQMRARKVQREVCNLSDLPTTGY